MLPLSEAIHETVVFLVGTNPKPDNIFVFTPRNGAVMETHINRPDVALRGKAQGWMERIRPEEGEFFVREFLDLFREFFVAFPEGWMGLRDYSHRMHRPARKSSLT